MGNWWHLLPCVEVDNIKKNFIFLHVLVWALRESLMQMMKKVLFYNFLAFLSFLTMRMHVQACVHWLKNTTSTRLFLVGPVRYAECTLHTKLRHLRKLNERTRLIQLAGHRGNLRRLHHSKNNNWKIIDIGEIIGSGKIDSFCPIE